MQHTYAEEQDFINLNLLKEIEQRKEKPIKKPLVLRALRDNVIIFP